MSHFWIIFFFLTNILFFYIQAELHEVKNWPYHEARHFLQRLNYMLKTCVAYQITMEIWEYCKKKAYPIYPHNRLAAAEMPFLTSKWLELSDLWNKSQSACCCFFQTTFQWDEINSEETCAYVITVIVNQNHPSQIVSTLLKAFYSDSMLWYFIFSVKAKAE